jgi:hypothetical protein
VIYVAVFDSDLFLDNITLYEDTTIILSIVILMDI